MKSSKKALIFGIDSFTGKYMQDCLESYGVEVFGTTFKQNIDTDCDITDIKQCHYFIDFFQPDYIINLAGISFVPHHNYQEIYDINFTGSLNIIQSCEACLPNTRLLLVSSAQVYSANNNAILEEDECKSNNHYSISKRMMEEAARLSNIDIRIVRSFNYTGKGQSVEFLLPKLVHHFKTQQLQIELGDLDVSRDFSDVRDVVNAYWFILTSKRTDKLFNVCSNRSYSLTEIITFLNKEYNYTIKINQSKRFMRNNSIKSILGSNKKLKELGWTPKYDLFDTLKWMSDD